MLTDIFAFRYADVPMWETCSARDSRLIVQAWRIIDEDVFPTGYQDKETDTTHAQWKMLNDKLSTELGFKELSKRYNGYWNEFGGNRNWVSYTATWRMMCDKFVCAKFDGSETADEFIKNRLSFVEIAFRQREEDIAANNANLPGKLLEARMRAAQPSQRLRVPGDPVEAAKVVNKAMNDEFQKQVDELNTRFGQAGYKLNYHNGYVQIASDAQVEAQIETPFWELVSDPKWKNVETDMATAIDMRDTGGPDPGWYAAKALESVIKIVSDDNGWTHGKEGGPHNYIENLGGRKNGQFIDAWEMAALKQFFTDVRRPFGHGAGSAEMPKLSDQQTNWTIEFCMSWTKSLIDRAAS